MIITMARPADAHFYRPVIAAIAERDHEVSVFVRDHEGLTTYLDAAGVDYRTLAPPGRTTGSRLWTGALFEARLLSRLRGRAPDVLTAVGGVAVAHLSAVVDASSVLFCDAETTPDPRLVEPFADEIHTPRSFEGSFGPGHRRYDGYQSLAYLHPRRYDADPAAARGVDVDPNAPFFLLEVNDQTAGGFSDEGRTTLASYLSTYGTVHVVGDGDIDPELTTSRISAENPALHHVLAFADLYVGNSPKRVTEAALLGTPAVRVSPRPKQESARLDELDTRGLIDRFDREAAAIRRVRELVPNPAARSVWRQRRDTLVASKVDVAGYAADAICAAGDEEQSGRPTTPIPGDPGGTSGP
ncbi:hypothetical protein ACKVMT_05605 [Halobacteriales archaeon Cl-PHB]